MSLINNIINPGPSDYYNPDFRIVFEDHLNYIINNEVSMISLQSVSPNMAARYAGDWRGLMMEMGVMPQMHWFNLRINGLNNSSDFDGSMQTVSVLNTKVVEKLMSSFKTRRKN